MNARDEIAPLHPKATGFSVFRCLPDGSGREYTAVEFDRGWDGAARFLRTLRAVGYVVPTKSGPGNYALLDVLDADGDVIQDYELPTRTAFAYVYRKLRLRIVRVEDVLAELEASREGPTA